MKRRDLPRSLKYSARPNPNGNISNTFKKMSSELPVLPIPAIKISEWPEGIAKRKGNSVRKRIPATESERIRRDQDMQGCNFVPKNRSGISLRGRLWAPQKCSMPRCGTLRLVEAVQGRHDAASVHCLPHILAGYSLAWLVRRARRFDYGIIAEGA